LRPRAAFTLIELLVVVGILAVLAAVGVANLLDARVRGRVALAKSEMRTLAGAVQAYRNDHNAYPYGERAIFWGCFGEAHGRLAEKEGILVRYHAAQLPPTTPVAYLTAPLADPFSRKGIFERADRFVGLALRYQYQSLNCPGHNPYFDRAAQAGYDWYLTSQGPARRHVGVVVKTLLGMPSPGAPVYDPTNGAVSPGRIIRTSKGPFTGTGT